MKLFKTFIMFLLWDIAFYIMASIMIIAKNYSNDKYVQTMDIQYYQMNIGLQLLLWLLVGAFIVFLFYLKRSTGSKNAKLVEFLVVSIPALFMAGTYFLYNYLHIQSNIFILNNMDLMMSFGALIFGCELFSLFIKGKR